MHFEKNALLFNQLVLLYVHGTLDRTKVFSLRGHLFLFF